MNTETDGRGPARRTQRFAVVASTLALAMLGIPWTTPATAAPQGCEVNAKATMLSGRFTQAEVEITVRYDAPDCNSNTQAGNVSVYKERCYSNFFINATTTERCKRFHNAGTPNSIWGRRPGCSPGRGRAAGPARSG